MGGIDTLQIDQVVKLERLRSARQGLIENRNVLVSQVERADLLHGIAVTALKQDLLSYMNTLLVLLLFVSTPVYELLQVFFDALLYLF